MAKSVDESKCVLRFSDFTIEPRRMLPPIQGYENMPLVSLEEAVDPLTLLVPEVERMAWTVKQNQFEGEYGLTDDESASILLYTMEWKPRDKSFYVMLNDTLQEADRELLEPWFLYLRLIMTSLAKLPSNSHPLTVYRGVKKDLSAKYEKGKTVTWWGFSSCTTSVDVLSNERFLGQSGTRTLFNIECYSAKNIKQYSFYPKEEEVLLPPARQFQVMGCLNQGNGLHIIQLKEIQPKFPLINLIPQPLTLSSKSTKQSFPPPSVEQTPITLKPPKCDNPRLQKYIDALYLDPTLTILELQYSGIGDQGAQHLANALQINKTLTTLNLGGNQIGPEGAQHLANALQINKTLTTLNLYNNKIGDQGGQHLANALQINKTLTTLNLYNNKIGDQGAQHLANALQINKTLTTLNLGVNQIGDQKAQHLANALQINKTLTTLNLVENKIGDDGKKRIMEILKKNTVLEVLL